MELTHEQREQVFEAYCRGIIDEETARKVCGVSHFQIAKENTEGAEEMFSGDIDRFFE